jgi:ABC-type multidrug transport system fused ATPase/permease subunit
MKTKSYSSIMPEQSFIKPAYLALLFTMALTGFAQMPIFKRYYIADIPGLGWLAQYYVTHQIHYIGAALFLFLSAYCLVLYLYMIRNRFELTGFSYLKVTLLAAIVVTGVFRVLKNLPDVTFSPGFTLLIDLLHLGFAMLFLLAGLVSLIARSRWLKPIEGKRSAARAVTG